MAIEMKRQTMAKDFAVFAKFSSVVLHHKVCTQNVKIFDYDLPLDLNQVNQEAIAHVCPGKPKPPEQV